MALQEKQIKSRLYLELKQHCADVLEYALLSPHFYIYIFYICESIKQSDLACVGLWVEQITNAERNRSFIPLGLHYLTGAIYGNNYSGIYYVTYTWIIETNISPASHIHTNLKRLVALKH